MTRSWAGVGVGLAAAVLLSGCDRGGEAEAPTVDATVEAEQPAADADQPPVKAPADETAGIKDPLAAPAASSAGEAQHFRALVSGYLDSYAEAVAGDWPRVRGVDDSIAAIHTGREHRWQVNLQRGQTYAFVGACDNECDNVDLVVEDPSGREVGSDVLPDDYPVVQLTPSVSGRYTARIVLVSCTIEPCYVGGRLLQR